MMTIFERVRAIILDPRATWQAVKSEDPDIVQLIINYAAPLTLIPSVCSLIGLTLVGIKMPSGTVMRAPFLEAFIGGALGYVLSLLTIMAVAWALVKIAPFFSSKADLPLAVKLVVYSMTPIWLVGIFSILPGLGILSILGLYSVYLLVLGLPVLLETQYNRLVWFTLAVVAVNLALNIIASLILFGLIYGPMYLRMMAR